MLWRCMLSPLVSLKRARARPREVSKGCQNLWHYKSIWNWNKRRKKKTLSTTECLAHRRKAREEKTNILQCEGLYLDVSITLIVTFDFIRRVHWKRTLAVEVIHSIFGCGSIAFVFDANGTVSTIRRCCRRFVIFRFVEFTLDIVAWTIQVIDGAIVVDVLIMVLVNKILNA